MLRSCLYINKESTLIMMMLKRAQKSASIVRFQIAWTLESSRSTCWHVTTLSVEHVYYTTSTGGIRMRSVQRVNTNLSGLGDSTTEI